MTLETVTQQVVSANTSQERQEARRLLHEWVSLHPEDEYAPALSYLLDCMEEHAREAVAEWEALQVKLRTRGAACLTVDEVARIGLSARSLEEIHHAREVLHAWEQAHPEERIMHEVYEVLYVREDGWRAEAAELAALAA
ncbi:MAG: hypothetical protein JO250_00895 [Armatimonadetes bacterium]|nr:hypothetical protein [Armatimonadota bacterium]